MLKHKPIADKNYQPFMDQHPKKNYEIHYHTV